MRSFLAVELIFYALASIFIITQVIVPAFRGTLLFPLFRARRRRVVADLARAAEDAELAELQRNIEGKSSHHPNT